MKKFIPLSVFAVAFATVEAAVVVYTRWLYYPNGFSFPVVPPPPEFMRVEMWREAATMLMLGAVGVAAGRNGWTRFAYFMFCFGLWDIFYYVWLHVFIGWPASLLDPDILFLIPDVWWGPVLAPCIIALSLCAAAAAIVWHDERGGKFAFKPLDIVPVALGTAIILYTFMADAALINAGQMPPPYRWGLFWVGELMGVGAFSVMLRRKSDG